MWNMQLATRNRLTTTQRTRVTCDLTIVSRTHRTSSHVFMNLCHWGLTPRSAVSARRAVSSRRSDDMILSCHLIWAVAGWASCPLERASVFVSVFNVVSLDFDEAFLSFQYLTWRVTVFVTSRASVTSVHSCGDGALQYSAVMTLTHS